MSRDHKSRRLFIADAEKYYKIFDFTQNRTDGSIYVASPDFSETKLLRISKDGGGRLEIVDSPGDGKLSIHGSGMAVTRAHDSPKGHTLVVHGNYLLNLAGQVAGLRHLFTTSLTKPDHVPASPAFNRESDVILRAGQLKPYVLVFWAVPAVRRLSINIMAAFNADELESVPPEVGFGSFSLVYHSIVWFGYRTKHMNRWPTNSHVCYYDGYEVPLLIGTREGEFRLEARAPDYRLSENELVVALNATQPG